MIKQDFIEVETGKNETTRLPSKPVDQPAPGGLRQYAPRLALLVSVLLAAFAWPLYDLVGFARGSELFSHVLLVPLVSLYLAWTNRANAIPSSQSAPSLSMLPLLGGCGLLVAYWTAVGLGWKPATTDYLAVMMLSGWLLLVGGVAWVGVGVCRALAFPLGFLLFAVPLPEFLINWLEHGLQRGSADAAHAFFWLSGTPVFRLGTTFQLPGFALEVAPECSGIHSSLVLLITGVLAGYLFLRSPWHRLLLTFFVVPLSLVRNGFRIFVIGQLCVNIGPEMVDSAIHRRGGPVFFALSLIPFFLLLIVLRKWGNRRRSPQAQTVL